MTRFPHEPLDAEERALAAALPRLHGRAEPDAALDARILAAAHAAAQARAAPKRRHWATPLALAASLCLAVGLAWQLRDPAPDQATAATVQAEPETRSSAFITPEPSPADKAESTLPVAKSAPAAAPAAQTAAAPARARRSPEPAAIEVQAAPMPSPRPAVAMTPPPAPPPPPPAMAAEPAARQAIAADAAASAAPRALAAPAAAAKARSPEPAERALEMQADAPAEDVPPATASSPEVRDAWLRRIGELMRNGKLDEARASLAEFRRRYPEAKLPDELHPLEQPAPEPASH